MRSAKRLRIAAVCLVFGAILMYLRDPAWLIGVESGFRGWEVSADSTRYRCTGGHASFFVRSEASMLSVSMRTTFAAPTDRPVTVRLSINDRPVNRILLTDEQWHQLVVDLPPPGSRRVHRIDVQVDVTRAGNRGVAMREVGIR